MPVCTYVYVCTYVTKREKTGLRCTKYTCSYFSRYLHFCKSYWRSVSFVKFSMLFFLRGKNLNWKVHIHKKLLTSKTWKTGQILCADKTGFLMLGHIYVCTCIYLVINNCFIIYAICTYQQFILSTLSTKHSHAHHCLL